MSINTRNLRKVNFLAFTAVLLFVALSVTSVDVRAGDDGSGFKIEDAKWDDKKNRIEVKGKGDNGLNVSVSNADTGVLLGGDEVDGDKWRVRNENPASIPCRVHAVQTDGQSADRDVRNAPADCDDGGVTPPPPSGGFIIEDAKWDDEKNRIEVKGKGDDGLIISVSNADTGVLLGSDEVDDDKWRVRKENSASIPCRIHALQSDGQSAGRDVRNAPADCDDGGGAPPPAAQCSDGIDNDGDGLTDFPADPGCADANDNDEFNAPPPPVAQCSDGIDNDGDGLTDFPADPGCADANDNDETDVAPPPPAPNVSINSTSQNTTDVGVAPNGAPVPEQPFVGNSSHRVMAINDLGMHCGDFDTRIASILPPFQVLLAQVVEKGNTPRLLDNTQAEVVYSSVSNSNDPILNDPNVFTGVAPDGSVFKTNFWNTVASGAYDPFYPPQVTPLAGAVTVDMGLPVPNVELLYIGLDGVPGTADDATGKDNTQPLVDRGTLHATQHAMPGMTAPYLGNTPHIAEEYYNDKPFFLDFPFGYVAENMNWFEGAGIPFSAYDDFGRENAYPLVRVQANVGGTTVATTDTVLPISGEASCKNCHSADVTDTPHAGSALVDLTDAADEMNDPAMGNVPVNVSVEYATDLNILKLHDQKHGTTLVTGTTADFPVAGTAVFEPVVCQRCHYTPALDLAHVGPLGADHPDANGRTQLSQSTMSNVMHSHHGSTGLFPDIPAPIQNAEGIVTNQAERVIAMEESCYQCHPGTDTQCLRGAMFNGDMLCSDCHGSMSQVGNDFSKDVSPTNVGGFILTGNFYDPTDPQPRVPWANEPGCGSCHTGDVTNNQAGDAGTVVNTRDMDGNIDGIRLRQAFLTGDGKATPIVPGNNRFAENIVPADFNGAPNPGAGNPQLYRVSTGHGGVMCEGCHGATHAEWPNANPMSNDNVTANQLQGHTGTITECTTCHTNVDNLSTDGSLSSLQGPHGMHTVGDNTGFVDADHKRNIDKNACRECHGQNGEGSVLSRTAADRDFRGIKDGGLVPKGTPVTCTECHGNEL